MKTFLKKIAAAVFVLSGACALLFSNSPYNENLSDEDRAVLSEGSTVIKNTASYKKMCIKSDNPYVKRAVETVSKLKPAYLAEVIREYPYEGNENLMDNFSSLVMDIPSYAGIPYYSERAEEWYDLYSSAKIVSSGTDGDVQTVKADFEMKPFGLVEMRIVSEKGDACYYYESTNLSTMRYYDKFNCVSPECMKSIIVIFREEEKWILYGIGAVKAPSVFFLRERVDTSFMNRIKTFCAYFFEKMEKKEETSEN
ncbi:DUF6675 family protein [Treponema sp.]|uniref:DUF6675 family protein n=1 Tax=Treponema sp. TaxID=166 RepID=UPI003F01C5F1